MSTPSSTPTVLIVGAGLGGLVLGALLEKASIPYAIFERAAAVKPLGSGHLIGPSLLPLFAQLGIEEEFKTLGRRITSYTITREVNPLFTIDCLAEQEYSGYCSYTVARPTLYDLLLKQVPAHKVLFGKRVLTITEKEERVTIQTSDNCIYEGDILVGADGAYSAVRQRMYERLKAEGRLPKSDQEELPFMSTCLVGQSRVLDPAQFPGFDGSSFYNNLGKDKPFSWGLVQTAQNTFCWMVVHHLDKTSSKAAEEHRFRESNNAQWGPHAAMAMCDETRHFPLKLGDKTFTMGDMYDWTPKEQISKVMLEEKVFHTWYSGRTVLVGDACHKLNPMGGQGAILAMHGALALANLIYALPSNTTAEIEKAFATYKAERIGPSEEFFKSSKMFSKFMEKGFGGVLLLFVMRRLPGWAYDRLTKRLIRNRPVAGYLEKIESKGTVPADVPPSAKKAMSIYEAREGSSDSRMTV